MSGKTILVTGASRGIGFEVSHQLYLTGHTVVAGMRRPAAPPDFVTDDRWIPVELDVTREDHVRHAAEILERRFGRLDVLVNNAGIGIGSKGLTDGDLKDMRLIFEVNFFSPIMLCSHLRGLLRQSKSGRIVNVSSGMGTLDDLAGNYAGYRLSKAGLNAQTILLARELKRDRIDVVAVCPGWVRTDMGGTMAPRSVRKGAEGIVWAATTPAIRTGKFYRDGKVIDW
jgi:NAD(P)-dependent dehydrogenase (short-subunit alcohol dehydrogenase family)